MVIIVLVVGISFSSFSYIKVLYTLEPNKNIMDGLDILKDKENGVVFSHYTRGNLIETITRKEALLDSVFIYNNGVNNKWDDSNKLFYLKDIDDANEIIDRYNITYIVIDKKMRESIWERKDDGLLFLLKFTTTKFKKLYDNNEIEVWEVV